MSIEDYRRGRAAVGALAGRRPYTHTHRRRYRLRPVAIAGAGTTAAAMILIAANSLTQPAGSTAPPVVETVRQPLPAVVADSSPERQIIPAIETRYADWDAAQASVGFTLRTPTLPAGYRMSAVQGFAVTEGQSPDDVIATYDGPGGATVVVDQAAIRRPGQFTFEKSIPDPPVGIAHGRLSINGQPAYWMQGISTWSDTGEPLGWRSDLLVVSWQADVVLYRLDATDLSLEQLVGVAESLK